jgi:hypothetical protein
MLSATLAIALTERYADDASMKLAFPFEPAQFVERLQLLEQENSGLQQLVCHLLRKNESLRTQLSRWQEQN